MPSKQSWQSLQSSSPAEATAAGENDSKGCHDSLPLARSHAVRIGEQCSSKNLCMAANCFYSCDGSARQGALLQHMLLCR